MGEDTVTISKSEYKHLMDAADKLLALEEMGVDNWEGYQDAMEALRESRRTVPHE